jgi:hypothetical protein
MVPTSAGKLKAEPVTRKGRFGGRLLFSLEWAFAIFSANG